MVSTFSPNIQLEEPARGDQVGVWDTPVNANMTLLDLIEAGKAVVFMTATDGLKVCMVIPLGDLAGAVAQLVAHVAPAEPVQKRPVVINGGLN